MHTKTRRTSQSGEPFFRAALQGDTLELTVYSEVGENLWDGGGVTAQAFKEQIDQAGDFQRILLRINSPGGDPFEGTAIHSLIRAQKKPVETYIDGIAASAASIIAMSGDAILMAPGAMMMIHNASGFCHGFAEDMYATGDALKAVSASIAQTYATRTKKPLAEIAAMMSAETWMSAQECLDNGFATAITQESDEVGQSALAMAKRFRALRAMKHVPAALRARNSEADCECDCVACETGNCDECNNADCVDPNCEDCPAQDSAASADLKAWRTRLGMKQPPTIAAARDRLEAIDRAAGGSTVESARARLEVIEETLSKPLEGRW